MNRYHDRQRLRSLRDDRRGDYDPRKTARKGLVGKVIAMVAVVAVAGLFASRMGCHAESVKTLPPKKELARLKPRELQQQTAEYGIEGGAVAGMKAIAASTNVDAFTGEAPDPVVEVTTAGYVVRHARSAHPHVLPTGREQAVREAEDEARRVLIEQGYVSPNEWQVSYNPKGVHEIEPTEEVRKAWAESGLETDRGWVVIDEVTLSHDTVRAERAKGRVAQVGFWFGTAFLGLLAAYGFLRLDMWTKGYLTLILGVIVGAVVVAAVVGLGVLVF